MAATELQAIVRFRFHDGDVAEFTRLSAQMYGGRPRPGHRDTAVRHVLQRRRTECMLIERLHGLRHAHPAR